MAGSLTMTGAARPPWRVVVAFLVAATLILAALGAPLIAPQNPFDVASFNLLDSELPPVWAEGGDPRFWLGTDSQGRDVLSAILYGTRLSLLVGVAAVLASMLIGVSVGLISGYFGGLLDAAVMRLADVILSFPTILIALLINGILRGLIPQGSQQELAPLILIVSIALNEWVQYARTVRGSTLVEKTAIMSRPPA